MICGIYDILWSEVAFFLYEYYFSFSFIFDWLIVFFAIVNYVNFPYIHFRFDCISISLFKNQTFSKQFRYSKCHLPLASRGEIQSCNQPVRYFTFYEFVFSTHKKKLSNNFVYISIWISFNRIFDHNYRPNLMFFFICFVFSVSVSDWDTNLHKSSILF